MQGLEECFALVSAGKISLPDLERVSIDDVQLFLIYLEWENKERARREKIERQKVEAEASRVPMRRTR